MSTFKRLKFLLRNWKQIAGLDTSIRDQTAAIQNELQRLREHRRVVQAVREKEALDDLRRLVGRMKELKQNLIAAEEAAVTFVDQLEEEAKQQLEANLNAEAETMIDVALRTSQSPGPEAKPVVSASATDFQQVVKAAETEVSGGKVGAYWEDR